MDNQILTKNIILLAGPEKWGWISRFARKVGIDPKNARYILTHGVVPRLETLQKIADAYGTTVSALSTDPDEINRVKEDHSPYLARDFELEEMLKIPKFRDNYNKLTKLLIALHKIDDGDSVGDMISAFQAMYKNAIKRKKNK